MKRFFMMLSAVGFLFLFGAAGAADQGAVETSTLLLRCIGSVLLIVIGYFGMKVLEYKQANHNRKQFQKFNRKRKHDVA